jgi:hypothetical protein
MLSLEEMKIEYGLASEDFKSAKSKTARSGIRDAMYQLKKKIDAEEHRVKTTLDIIDVNGTPYQLPKCFDVYDHSKNKYTYEEKDGCLYMISPMKLDEDGSYHLHHYVWIPQAVNKFVRLTVRTLGNDRYGDRYFLNANYYKHPADPYSYMEKVVYTNNYGYKEHYKHVFSVLGLKQKKDKHETNKLEWIEELITT